MLFESKGDLLDDEQLIETLQRSQIESDDIKEKLKKQEVFAADFENIRKNFKDVARRVSSLYFVILDLA